MVGRLRALSFCFITAALAACGGDRFVSLPKGEHYAVWGVVSEGGIARRAGAIDDLAVFQLESGEELWVVAVDEARLIGFHDFVDLSDPSRLRVEVSPAAEVFAPGCQTSGVLDPQWSLARPLADWASYYLSEGSELVPASTAPWAAALVLPLRRVAPPPIELRPLFSISTSDEAVLLRDDLVLVGRDEDWASYRSDGSLIDQIQIDGIRDLLPGTRQIYSPFARAVSGGYQAAFTLRSGDEILLGEIGVNAAGMFDVGGAILSKFQASTSLDWFSEIVVAIGERGQTFVAVADDSWNRTSPQAEWRHRRSNEVVRDAELDVGADAVDFVVLDQSVLIGQLETGLVERTLALDPSQVSGLAPVQLIREASDLFLVRSDLLGGPLAKWSDGDWQGFRLLDTSDDRAACEVVAPDECGFVEVMATASVHPSQLGLSFVLMPRQGCESRFGHLELGEKTAAAVRLDALPLEDAMGSLVPGTMLMRDVDGLLTEARIRAD